MIDLRAVFASVTVIAWLAGCGRSSNTPVPPSAPIAEKPNVIVTIDGKRRACVVALYTEAQGSTVACDDVVSFIKNELRVPSGSIFDLRTIPEIDDAQVATVGGSLKDAGYLFIGGPNARFTTGSR
jgi:hypothetical protein